MPEDNLPLVQIQLPDPSVSVSPLFKQVLAEIPELNKKSAAIQKTNIDELNEDDITELNKKMRELSTYNKKFKAVDKAIKDAYDTPRDKIRNWYHEQLNAAGFDDFQENIKKNKQLRRDVLANRINKRWEELETTFNGSLEAYPKIKEIAPQLASFTNFRVRHPKLISGSKTKKVTDKIRAQVTNEIADYANAIADIEANTSHLLPPYQRKLLSAYIENPTPETLLNQTRQLIAQQQTDLKLQEEQKKRQAELAKQQANTQQKPTTQPTTPPVTPLTQATQPTAPADDYTWLINYIYSIPHGRDIHNNDRVKANVLYDMYNKINIKGTIWNKKIGLNASRMIALTRYILSL